MPRKPKFVYGNTREELQDNYEGNQAVQVEAGKVPEAFYDRPMIKPKEDAFEVMKSAPKPRGRPVKEPKALTVAPKVVSTFPADQLTLPGITVPERPALNKDVHMPVPGITQNMLENAIRNVLREMFGKFSKDLN